MLYKFISSTVLLLFVCQPGFTQDFTEVAKHAIPAVVSIQVKASVKREQMNLFDDPFFNRFFGGRGRPHMQQPQEQIQMGQGSGFLVSDDGYILTNSHVVKDAKEIKVVLNDGRELKAKLIGLDPNTDVALIHVESSNLPYLDLANSDDLEVGQWVIAIGNPLGLQASLTVGVVSAKGRNNVDIAQVEDFIQTDAAINRGNSGGPLLNMKGEVVGMNTAIVSGMGGEGFMGIGFAIPSNIANHVMQDLVETGSVTRGFMGVVLQQIDSNLASAFNLPSTDGVLVADVSKDSPAENAGLKQGDVILKYNNKTLRNRGELRNAVSLMKPGTEINLSVLREGKEVTLPLTVGAFPEDHTKIAQTVNKLGFEVENLTAEIARKLGVLEGKGVVVSKVNPNSTAALAGIRVGALILSVNQQPIENTAQFQERLKESPQEKPILLLVQQGEFKHWVSIKTN